MVFDATLIPRGHCTHVFSKKDVLHFCNMVRKAASMKQMIHSKMCNVEDTVKGVWRHGEKMSYQDIRNVYFLQKNAELMEAGFTILESCGVPERFSKKLTGNVGGFQTTKK